jgi:hypothetical protein
MPLGIGVLDLFPAGDVFFWAVVFLLWAFEDEDAPVLAFDFAPVSERDVGLWRAWVLPGFAFAEAEVFAAALVDELGFALDAVPFKEDLALAGGVLPLAGDSTLLLAAGFLPTAVLLDFVGFGVAPDLPVGVLPEGLLLDDTDVFLEMAVVFS